MSSKQPQSSHIDRRAFIKKTGISAASIPVLKSALSGQAVSTTVSGDMAAPVRWLDGEKPVHFNGSTWGLSWPEGSLEKDASFKLTSETGESIPVQSWPTAYWPDGSLKWTAHAVPAKVELSSRYRIEPGQPRKPEKPLTVTETANLIRINTGVIEASVLKKGETLIQRITRGTQSIAEEGRLVCLLEDRSSAGVKREVPFTGSIDQVTVEQTGPIRAVVKVEGRHVNPSREWLPFTVRFYFYAGGESIRMLHTIIFDGDEKQDFIAGLGVRFSVPMESELYDRHVRFAGPKTGIFGEAVQGLTGLRRDPGQSVREAQIDGSATPPKSEWSPQVTSRLAYVPVWNDWTLDQLSADGFQIRKRTKEGQTWLTSAQGGRAGGFGYIGSPEGGLAFGLRNFWQSFPAQFDIRDAAQKKTEVTVWMWAPNAQPMDLRPYHDGMGQDTYDKQYNGGLEITYEDYEPGFDTPHGVARTSELFFWALDATPSHERLSEMSAFVREPPVLTTTPEYLHACGVFGDIWKPVDRTTPQRAAIEDQLEDLFAYYKDQQEERRWYGFWNYGDVMHTYDADRHEWRYDVGGFAWDNSELSTDLWLWLYFLRSGKADVFRFAEAMTRHTGEVDVYHLGRFAPLGSRHNVLHWGCSAKQLRISTALNRRYYFYLTADDRVGDLMREQIEAGRTLLKVPPGRKLAHAASQGDLARAESGGNWVGMSFGTDWGSQAGAWLTEWERTGDVKMRDRLLAGMHSIGAQPNGFFSTGAAMNLDTGEFTIADNQAIGFSHLTAVFGLVELSSELNRLLDVPAYRKAWIEYCRLCNASTAEQEQRFGRAIISNGLRRGHSRLTAYAARALNDPDLASRAWLEFKSGRSSDIMPDKFLIGGSAVLRPIEEAPMLSTNGAAQSGLAAIQCLALI
ncbi:MAG: Tat pathway signal sequence domain protein, partial [Verrucomicrobiae bacterium]|nr:Tat pathway signal sequence domain protein [Verrucomicrobiae bacterium]